MACGDEVGDISLLVPSLSSLGRVVEWLTQPLLTLTCNTDPARFGTIPSLRNCDACNAPALMLVPRPLNRYTANAVSYSLQRYRCASVNSCKPSSSPLSTSTTRPESFFFVSLLVPSYSGVKSLPYLLP